MQLCQQYGITEGSHKIRLWHLAYALACELYPEPKKRGRKQKWASWKKGVLVVEVERLTKPDGTVHSVGWACKRLAKREPWVSFLKLSGGDSGHDPAEALRQTYYGFRDSSGASLMRDYFQKHECEGDIEGWEKQVIDSVKYINPK